MICPKNFTNELLRRGIQFFTGVPCSYLTPLINEVISRADTDYVIASSEGEALAMASGAWLAGKSGVVMCQNSGLGNMVNPLTSLNAAFDIPVLLLVTWRGKPGEPDEPQHEMMGKITTDLLDLIDVKWSYFPDGPADLSHTLDIAWASMQETHRPYALVLKKDSFSSDTASKKSTEKTTDPSREEALSALLKCVPMDSLIIATTGKTGREFYTLQDREGHLYCVGSMGYANALAHGLALNANRGLNIIQLH